MATKTKSAGEQRREDVARDVGRDDSLAFHRGLRDFLALRQRDERQHPGIGQLTFDQEIEGEDGREREECQGARRALREPHAAAGDVGLDGVAGIVRREDFDPRLREARQQRLFNRRHFPAQRPQLIAERGGCRVDEQDDRARQAQHHERGPCPPRHVMAFEPPHHRLQCDREQDGDDGDQNEGCQLKPAPDQACSEQHAADGRPGDIEPHCPVWLHRARLQSKLSARRPDGNPVVFSPMG